MITLLKNTVFFVLAVFSTSLFAQVKPGIHQIEKYVPLLTSKNVAVVGNHSSQFETPTGRIHLVDSLLRHEIRIVNVFAPEHGFRGKEDAGATIEDEVDVKTGIPIVSLHGKNRKPTQEQLKHIDVVVFDIQDVGVRFFTYLSTLHLVLEACADSDVPVVVLDRPNPNAHYIDGPVMREENQSFLGKVPVPLVYGMTIGEYAKMLIGERWLSTKNQVDLIVIPIENYTHQTPYQLPIRPSPNLPNSQAIALYPSLGLFEGTTVNAGRGTNKPFQQFGASFLHPEIFTHTYSPKSVSGASNPKEKGKVCYGVDLSSHPKMDNINLEWLVDAYNHAQNKDSFFLDPGFRRHAGTSTLQHQIEKGMTAIKIRETWKPGIAAFVKIRTKYLIYP
ncbi:MAG: DUF1343 domain-containing protein [Flavobacteriaceae bacterium]|nr:DUF1343 domain-containing protein [Flavobacteriaceae bacterium]